MDEVEIATASPIPDEKEETIHSTPQYKGKLYGIELEIEAEGLYSVEEHFDEEHEEYIQTEPNVPEGWLREQEDSIEGCELISQQPYDYETSVTNIKRVFADISRMGFVPVRTPRGSTHIHANVADLTWRQMKHFVTACAWAEPALIELAGKGRKGNLFAQSYETTPMGWATIIQWVRRQEIAQNVDTHYMAISFHPMGYLGSVEFRMGPSSRSEEDAIRWLQCIDAVVEAGRYEEINPYDVPFFLIDLTSKMDQKKRERVIKKGQRFATEVWEGMSEPFERVVPRRSAKMKSLAALMAEQQNYAPSINSYTVSLEDMADLYPSQEQPAPGANCPVPPAPAPYPGWDEFMATAPNVQVVEGPITNPEF